VTFVFAFFVFRFLIFFDSSPTPCGAFADASENQVQSLDEPVDAGDGSP
jgi:hypothetical protein